MSLTILSEAPPLTILDNGSVRIAGTRIGLEHIVANYRAGWTPERIVDEFSTLELADVHAVIAYYLRHRDDVDRYVAAQDDRAEQIREEIEQAGIGGATLRKKLINRRNAGTGG